MDGCILWIPYEIFWNGVGFLIHFPLPEDWHDEEAGTYSSRGIIPTLKGATFIKGEFQNTLPVFFAKHRPKAALINFDADLTIHFVRVEEFDLCDRCKYNFIFDEFIMNPNWEQDEYSINRLLF